MEMHLFWWPTPLFDGGKLVSWLQAHWVPCQGLQHKALRLDTTHIPGKWTQLLQNATMIPLPQMPERFSPHTPTGKKENQKIEYYSPGSYREMSYLKGTSF